MTKSMGNKNFIIQMTATQKMFLFFLLYYQRKKTRFHVKSNQLAFIIYHCAYFEKEKIILTLVCWI